MQSVPPFCALCGVACTDPQECRVASVGDVQGVVQRQCGKTSMHYASLMSLPPGERRALCVPCSLWKRRVDKRPKRSFAAPIHTPLDSVLLHAISPGKYAEPDKRSFQRLARAASDKNNGYAAIVPACLRELLSRRGPALAEGQVAFLRKWWKANANTSFFRFPETARGARHCFVNMDPLQEGARRRWRR